MEAVRTEGGWIGEMVAQGKDGALFHVHVASSLVVNDAGQPVCMSASFADITQHKKAEEALRESEERHRTILQTAMEGFCRVDTQGRFLEVNAAYCQMSGYSVKELLAMRIPDLAASDTPEQIAATMQKIMAQGKGRFETRHHHKNGSIYDVEISIQYRPDDGGQLVVFLHDITERKRAEERIELLRFEREQILNSSADGIIRLDTEGNHVFVNHAAANMLGYEVEELLGKSSHRLYHHTKADGTPYPEQECPILEAYRDGKSHYVNEDVFWKKDGVAFPVEYGSTPIKEKDVVVGAVLSFRNITKRKRAEEERRKSEEKFRNLFNNAEVGMFRTKLDGSEVLDSNDKYLSMLGMTREEFIGKPSVIVWDDPKEREEMVKMIKAQGYVSDLEFRLRNRAGEVRNCITSLKLYPETGILEGSIIDITDRKIAESALKEQSKRVRELSARLSEAEEAERKRISRELHDQVGQSLTALGINLNIIRSMDLMRVNANIRQRLDESLKLIEQTAEFTRDMMADLRPPVMDDYGLMASIRWYGEQFSARTGIEFEFKGEDVNPRPDALIEVALFRIIQESLTNVSKHARAKRVEITGEVINNRLKITIKDDGIGFNPKTVYITDARHHWGIAMMAERAESIGGHFSIMSEPGQGSTINVEVPI